jgi:alcohol dehydrogenase (NADP+)
MSITQSIPEIFEVGGFSIPAVGFGTFQSDDGNKSVKDVVRTALRNGYRLIDTGAAYGNEKEVGDAIRESGLPRSEIFVTSKLYKAPHPRCQVVHV